jgi:hypothetical protein
MRTKSVKLAPNDKEMVKEVLNYSVTLSKKLLLMNSSKIGRLSSRHKLLMKKRPHLMSPLKFHNISSKAVLHTSYQNRDSMSILIKSSPVCVKLRLVRSQTILIISKKLLIFSSYSLLCNHWLGRSRRTRRTWKFAGEKIPKPEITHV